MPFDLRDIPYDDFVRFVFDHRPRADGEAGGSPAWFWNALERAHDDGTYVEPACDPALQVAHLTRLCREAAQLPASYTPAQLEQGFWFLFSAAGENLVQAPLFDPAVPWPDRATALASLADLYEGLFSWEPCGDAAYMLFDGLVCGRYGYPHSEHNLGGEDVRTRAHLFGVLQRILALPSATCQRGALHGLGHLLHPGTDVVIDRFLASGRVADEEIVAYAAAARTGDVQ